MLTGIRCFIALVFVLAATAVRADDAARTMLLIDGSGSMWARFETEAEKRAKIDVVRELVKPLVSGAGQTGVGLASYGHRRKGDCSDVEIMAEPGTDRAAVLDPLEKLNPKGKGPLAEGLRQAAAALGPGRPANILAITDGADNCRQDACAAAEEIAKASPGLAIHVVSIGVEAVDLPRLQCITKATGGKFYDARDPLALAAAVNEAASLAMGHGPAAASAPAPSAATPTPAQMAGASLRATVALAPKAGPLAMTADWRIEKTGSEEPPRHITAPQIAESLPPGTYDVEARIGDLAAQSQVTIEEGKPQDLALTLNAARLKVVVKRRDTPGDGSTPPLVTIARRGGEANGQTVWIGRSDGLDTLLQPATYAVSVADGHTRQEKEIALALGTEETTEFALGTGRLSLTAATQDGGDSLSDVTFSILVDDPESADGRRELFRSRAPAPEFTLPPGTYYVVAATGNAEVRQRIALSAGDSVQKTLVIPAAQLRLSAQVCNGAPGESAGLLYRIYALEGTPREIARSTHPKLEETLNAGKYRLVASLEAHAVQAVQDVVLDVTKPADVTMKIDCGEVKLKPPAMATAIVPGEAFWEVRDQSGKAVWHATAAEPTVLLNPGHYSVRVDVRDQAVEAAFEVRNGEHKIIEIGSK